MTKPAHLTSKRVDKRRLELEQWKKNKQQAQELMKKISKPPFRPVGKATLLNSDKPYLDQYLNNKSVFGKTRLQQTVFNKTQSKFTSTPFHKTEKSVAKPQEKQGKRKSDSRRNTFEKLDLTFKENINPESHNKISKNKSVTFKDDVEEIYPTNSTIDEVKASADVAPLENDEARRIINAGQTPLSCTSSRSGSTPGRRDCPSLITNTEGNTFNEMLASRISNDNSGTVSQSINKKKSTPRKYSLKWYVPRGSIMERDPYILRPRTPTSTKVSTPARALQSGKKKNNRVSFGKVTVNTGSDNIVNVSPTFDTTYNNLMRSSVDISTQPVPILNLDNKSVSLSPNNN